MMLKRVLLLFSVFQFSVFIINCSETITSPEPRDTISGYVTDSITNLPIDSAKIIFGDTLTSQIIRYTNNEGWYSIIPDTFGLVEVFCLKNGYISKNKTVDLPVNNLVVDDFDFKLTQ